MDEETSPLRLDARTVLEAISGTLAFVLAGIAAINLGDPYNVIVPLIVGALIVMINRLLGRSAAEAVAVVGKKLDRVIAENTVLRTDASASTRKAAAEAGAALNPPRDPAPPEP